MGYLLFFEVHAMRLSIDRKSAFIGNFLENADVSG